MGASYRSRYLDPESDHQIRGISPDQVKQSQIYASAPNQAILSNTATAFLQGLYPPLSDSNPDLVIEALNNGSDSSAPLEGYQYVLLQGMDDDSPDSIWIKGDDACPAYADSSAKFSESKEYLQRVEATRDFYAGFYRYLDGVYDLTPEGMTYDNAYDIFDLLNVARIHNESSSALDISADDMLQLRTLADSSEFGANYNASQPARSIGAQTLAGTVLARLDETVRSAGRAKLSVLAGSYDTFLAFFGVMGLTDLSDDFTGLPGYASTMAFELLSDSSDNSDDEDAEDAFPAEKDLRVRWLFKNGTDGDLTPFPLFGRDEPVLRYTDFVAEMRERAVEDVGTWCGVCAATVDFCAAYADEEGEDGEGAASNNKSTNGGGISNAVAGVIGAVVALVVAGLVGAVAFVVMRRRSSSAVAASAVAVEVAEKRSVGSVSGSGSGSLA